MNKIVLIAGGSTLVYAGLALMMGVLPGIALSRTPSGPGIKPISPLEAEGRDVYVANGCSYCHTQQVRPLEQDKVFGRPSAPGDFAYQTPELLGSERTGPDLTNIGARQPSSVWQYIHLYNPRAVVPQSIMPSFSWMFDVVDKAPQGVNSVPLPKEYAPSHGVVIPSHQAQALLAYLLSLKQTPWPNSKVAAGGDHAGASSESSSKESTAVAANGGSAAGYDAKKGQQLFSTHCSVCHQETGEGLPGAFPPLKGDAAVNDADPATHIHTVLFGLKGATVGGVKYDSEMPNFGGTLNDADIANIINYERSSWGNHGKHITDKEVAAIRAKGK
ncbi:Cbb3-type cytochrome oxidase, cytochrome c subunit [Hyphomicrobium denitrificans 1NES1]|uniref:Cbb3-type cytochrome oxidase, cytochrome c subunit n=1 Tax=Hyphomicrobium denitrificans 1NES1 TaxID=670307 RepID=N0BDS4_9HYPH|nr:cbb3-type cytochrome c oxidase subunit II [Hyphomicrobium denitrificans]AGK58646.1 Cbb3-type cytochrome oxidase, cytochrome c subunit [Hyphomicrobium denitrificans 1NES1]